MLKPKLKKCGGCGLDKIIWKDGKCQQCSRPSFKGLANSGMKRKPFKKTFRAKKPGNKKFYEEQAIFHQESPVSFESGKHLGQISNVNLAHIFPKTNYESIAHEPSNIILLTWSEHTRFDELLNAHEFVKLEKEFESWDKICERIKLLLPLCKEHGKLKLQLIDYLQWDTKQ